jgi:hypothetical protein
LPLSIRFCRGPRLYIAAVPPAAFVEGDVDLGD